MKNEKRGREKEKRLYGNGRGESRYLTAGFRRAKNPKRREKKGRDYYIRFQ